MYESKLMQSYKKTAWPVGILHFMAPQALPC